MTTDIEPGDLIRTGYSGEVKVAENGGRFETIQVIAKGPGWVRHDGSSVNPVPGASCEIYGGADPGRSSHIMTSERWTWPLVQFYRVTSPAVPAPVEAPELSGLRAENARLREAAEGVISWWNMDGALATCRDALEPLRAALKEGGGE